jgi:hypothetical protein
MVVIFQLLVPILIVAQTPFIPESPRWYVKKGKLESARESLSRVRDTEQDVADELLMIREAIEFEKEAISSSYSALWKDPSVRKRFGLALVINAGQQITGQGSLNSYSTKIYQKVFKSASTIALINALNATFGILFTLNATWTVDRFGRRFLFIVGGIGMALCMLVVATVETQTPTLAGGSKSHPVAVAIVFLLFLFIFFYKPSWGATVWIWTSEVFSMNIRAQAVGMASQTQNIANLVVNQFFPTFLTVSPNLSACMHTCCGMYLIRLAELWILCFLHVRRHQRPACHLRLLLRPGDKGCHAGGNGRRVWWCQSRERRGQSHGKRRCTPRREGRSFSRESAGGACPGG